MPEPLNEETPELSTPTHGDDQGQQRSAVALLLSRRQFMTGTTAAAGVATFGSLSALLSGCGSSNRGPLPNLVNPAGGGSSSDRRGAIEGYVFQPSSGGGPLVLGATSAPPDGTRPAAGLTAAVANGGPNAQVGSDGRIRLQNVPPGHVTLQISGTGITPLEVPVTVVPDAIIPLGRWAVPRSDAASRVRALLAANNLTASADLLATSQPLPAGVVIRSALLPDAPAATVERPSWFFYADTAPSARFGHDTYFILVDATNGSGRVWKERLWPTLNNGSFYKNSELNAVNPDAVVIAGPGSRAGRTGSSPTGRAAAGAGACRAADGDDARTHLLIVQGDRREDFAADPEYVMERLAQDPFPSPGEVRVVKTFEETTPVTELVLREFAAVRDAAQEGDTLVVYVTSHGVRLTDAQIQFMVIPPAPDGASVEQQAQNWSAELPPEVLTPPAGTPVDYRAAFEPYRGGMGGSFETPFLQDFRGGLFDIRQLDFRPTKACRIILFADTCHSGYWIPILRPQLDALEKKDILILAAAAEEQVAQGISSRRLPGLENDLFTFRVGGLFTQTILSRLNEVSGELPATDALESTFIPSLGVVNGFGFGQLPQRYRRPLKEGEYCVSGSEEVTVQ